MIASCPACQARFRIDRERLSGKRITLRCVRCREIFKIDIAASAPAGNRLRVLLAHSDPILCDTIRDILTREGMECRVCHDGSEALRQMEMAPPQAAILDVAIPGLYIFELVEQVRRLPLLQETRVILLSSVYNKMAYKRTPSSLYGADDYIEKHHIPDDLVPKIYRLTGRAENITAQPQPREEILAGLPMEPIEKGSTVSLCQEMNSQIQRAENQELSTAGDQRDKALRLARIIAADIALYNQGALDEGIRTGDVFSRLASELEEGERLFKERTAHGPRMEENQVRQAFAELVEGRRTEMRRLTRQA